MPRLTKLRKAAVLREKVKKLRKNAVDPLAWTFENPWSGGAQGYIIPSEQDTGLGEDSGGELLSDSSDAADANPNYLDGVISELSDKSDTRPKSMECCDSADQSDSIFVGGPVSPKVPPLQPDCEILIIDTSDEKREECSTDLRHAPRIGNVYENSLTKLSQTKTTIIELPPMYADEYLDPTQACGCQACIKCKAYQEVSSIPVSKPFVNVHRTMNLVEDRDGQHGVSYDAAEPITTIDNCGQPKPLSRFKNTQGFIHSGSKVPAKRLCAINANDYYEMEVPHWKQLEGRRIVDYDYFLKWLLVAQASHSRNCHGVLCPFQENVVSMVSTLYLMCNVCKVIVKGYSEEPSAGTRLRHSTDWAILCSGSTYTMTYELFSFLNIPFMAAKTFMKDEIAMDAILESALEESLDRAVRAEKEIVFQEMRSQGLDFSEDQTINISAVLDGSWGQRSNGHRYSSASGCAAIIGTRSKKVCFVGCRNKRCSACDRNELNSTGDHTNKHKCCKNYQGSSGGMEPSIIKEGFEKLYEKNVKVTTVVTDGDSTTVAKLKNSCKYGHEIQQQLCCNHVLKNAGKKLREIKCAKQVSDDVAKGIDRITRGIRCAVVHCAETTGGKDVEGLRQDIRNAPYHVFGCHENCREYFCKHDDKESAENLVPLLQKLGIWNNIMVIIEKLAGKAEFISKNETSNLVENLYGRLCKYNVGKRIDTMSRGSYQRRVQITVLQHNEGYLWHDKHMEAFTGEPPGHWTKKMFEVKSKALECTRVSQNRPNFTRCSRNKHVGVEKDYGEAAVTAFEEATAKTTDVEMKPNYEISEKSSRILSDNITLTTMEEFARGRILAKFVPEIVGSKDSTKQKKCDGILQTSNVWNLLKSNRSLIGLVLRELKNNHGINLEENRMCIDKCHHYLCCVPDAISADKSTLLLIKKKDVKGGIREHALTRKASMGFKIKNENVVLDKHVIVEAQASMHICNASKAIIMFLNSNNHTDYIMEEVNYDNLYFKLKIEEKVQTFFESYILKKVVRDQIPIKT